VSPVLQTSAQPACVSGNTRTVTLRSRHVSNPYCQGMPPPGGGTEGLFRRPAGWRRQEEQYAARSPPGGEKCPSCRKAYINAAHARHAPHPNARGALPSLQHARYTRIARRGQAAARQEEGKAPSSAADGGRAVTHGCRITAAEGQATRRQAGVEEVSLPFCQR